MNEEIYTLKYEDLYGSSNKKEEEKVELDADAEELKNCLIQSREIVREVFGKNNDITLIEKIGVTLFIQKREKKKIGEIMNAIYPIVDAIYLKIGGYYD